MKKTISMCTLLLIFALSVHARLITVATLGFEGMASMKATYDKNTTLFAESYDFSPQLGLKFGERQRVHALVGYGVVSKTAGIQVKYNLTHAFAIGMVGTIGVEDATSPTAGISFEFRVRDCNLSSYDWRVHKWDIVPFVRLMARYAETISPVCQVGIIVPYYPHLVFNN